MCWHLCKHFHISGQSIDLARHLVLTGRHLLHVLPQRGQAHRHQLCCAAWSRVSVTTCATGGG